MTEQRVVRLKSYANGNPTAEMFDVTIAPTPEPKEGEAQIEVRWLSMDPFPRMQMTGSPGGPPQLGLGDVVIGRGAGRVVASRRADLRVGDWCVCEPGWREHACVSGPVRVVNDERHARAALGVLGPSGLTAHFALTRTLTLNADDTLVVTAAAGAVGSAACQIAQALGVRVIAIVSGPEQVAFLQGQLGVETVIDRLAAGELSAALKAAAPKGITAALDTVGGAMFEALLTNAAPRARIALVGFISAYGGERPRYIDPYALIFKRASVTGFLLADFTDQFEDGYAHLNHLFDAGQLRAFESVWIGLEQAPRAFSALFNAAPPGKQLVRVRSDVMEE